MPSGGSPMRMAQSLPAPRITSIDLLRGAVMVIMALDHVRDYFHADAFLFDPADLERTTAPIFLTRWISHFCAPVFVFLAGTSAWFVHRRRGTAGVSAFLFKRGLWLVALEVTVVTFAWSFNPAFPVFFLQVIWAIGMGMLALAAAVHLPLRAIAAIGAVLVFGHNALDGLDFGGAWWWAALHQMAFIPVDGRMVGLVYPVLPWIGTMLLGYCFGTFYGEGFTPAARKRALRWAGATAVMLFTALRATNLYGDPRPWAAQDSALFTVFSFIETWKYPPSLLFLLMTLGPALLLLSAVEGTRGRGAQALIVLGRVPFFYYIVHIVLLHLGALLAAQLTGFHWTDMVLTTWVTMESGLQGYGFGLPVVYLLWAALVLGLYPLCRWYDRLKSRKRHLWWLSYL